MTPEIKSIIDLFNKNLSIPNYQRPYKWTNKNIEDLLTDIEQAIIDHSHYKDFRYRIGTILLHNNGQSLDIVDGQQRIISLLLIYSFILPGFSCPLLQKTKFTNKVSQSNIRNNYDFITHWFSSREDKHSFKKAFSDILEVVVICVDKTAEAFQLFDSQNSRGKELDPHDLLKAYHLREMTDDLYEMEHAVESWEIHSPSEIRTLFESYLFPIYNWSKGNKTDRFSAKHIDVFKGIEEHSSYTYAKRASKASPVFQIPEPIIAGNDFFSYVGHYLSLLNDIKRVIDTEDRFAEIREIINKPEYRSTGFKHSVDLFYCALLCYYDRFHILDKPAVTNLFSWAMMIRVDMEHLSYDTINKYAIGEDSDWRYTNRKAMFSIIHNARKHTEIANMRITMDYRDGKKWNNLYKDIMALNGK